MQTAVAATDHWHHPLYFCQVAIHNNRSIFKDSSSNYNNNNKADSNNNRTRLARTFIKMIFYHAACSIGCMQTSWEIAPSIFFQSRLFTRSLTTLLLNVLSHYRQQTRPGQGQSQIPSSQQGYPQVLYTTAMTNILQLCRIVRSHYWILFFLSIFTTKSRINYCLTRKKIWNILCVYHYWSHYSLKSFIFRNRCCSVPQRLRPLCPDYGAHTAMCLCLCRVHPTL